MRVWRRARVVVATAVLVVACGGEDAQLPTSYEIGFPSNDVAIVTDSVSVFVIDATGREADVCNELFAARTAGIDFDRVLSQTRIELCNLVGASPPLNVSFGTRALFVAATSVDTGDADFLRGCAVAHVGADTPKPRVDLSLAGPNLDPKKVTRPVDCRSVSDRCAKQCTK